MSVFANGPGDLGSIIPKTLKMVLDTSLLNTQHYKVRIKGKVEQSWEKSSALNLHFGVVAVEKGAFGWPLTKGRQLYLLFTFTSTDCNMLTMCRQTVVCKSINL